MHVTKVTTFLKAYAQSFFNSYPRTYRIKIVDFQIDNNLFAGNFLISQTISDIQAFEKSKRKEKKKKQTPLLTNFGKI